MITKKNKANQLSISARRRIIKAKIDNPKLSANEIAQAFKCTITQVYYTLENANEFHKILKVKRRKKRSSNEVSYLTELIELCKDSIYSLKNDTQIPAIDLINAVDKITSTLKKLQEMELAGHLRRADAQIVAAIIRRFEPDATDADIIRIYRETKESL